MLSAAQERAADRLIAAAGARRTSDFAALPGGANNRVYRVETDAGPRLLKAYYHHPDESRDRLAGEHAFAAFAWAAGVGRVPRPFGADGEAHVGLYEFVPGRRPRPGEVGRAKVAEALDFYRALNRRRDHPLARALPPGAEACFTLAEHLACVERRVRRLEGVGAASEAHRACAAFVAGELAPAWARVRREAEAGARALGLDLDEALPAGERRLSPSDFGFHNALVEPGGGLRFIDLEYAGWDDPAKTVCDFFCQPAVPAPAGLYAEVAGAVAAETGAPQRHRRRFDLLLPVYRVKWVCIMLNDFTAADARRRRFAAAEAGEARLSGQLARARRALAEAGAPLVEREGSPSP